MLEKISKPSKNKQFSQTVDTKNEIPKKYFYFFIIAFTFLLYANSIRNDYSFDDGYVVNVEPAKKSQDRSVFDILTKNYIKGFESGEEVNFGYRPVVQLTFALDHLIFRNSPHFSHFINLMLFITIAVLLFHVLLQVFYKYTIWVPFLVVLLFIAHPINTEVVCSLKNRDVLLSFFCSLISLHLFLQYSVHNTVWKLILAFLFFALGLYSKISTLPYVVIIPMFLYYFKNLKISKVILFFLVLLIFAIIVNYLPKFFLEPSYRPKFFYENPLFFNRDILLKISTSLYILFYYLKLVIVPHPLLYYYGYQVLDIVNWADIKVWLSLVIHLALLGYALWKIKTRSISSFAILYYLITISMFANLYRPPAGIIADRFLFRPVLGFCIIIVVFVFKQFKVDFKTNNEQTNLLRDKAIIPFIIILTLYSFKTINRITDWKDTLTLVKHDMPYLEKSAKANYIYAGLLRTEAYNRISKTGIVQEGLPYINQNIECLNKAIKIYPDYYDAYDKLAESYYVYLKNPVKAIECLKKSLRINPKFGLAYYDLGFIFRNEKQYDSAIWNIKQAIRLQSGYKPYYQYLASIYFETGDTLKANEVIQLSKVAKKKNLNRNRIRKERKRMYNFESS
jgi:protein O-mannosyl-transferase